jgi:molybdopterin/thiamine biosynthesis adenylyltransferase
VIWYIENTRRNRQEREALEVLASSVDWLSPVEWRIDSSLRLMWDADITTAGHIFPISLRYPNHFPHSPPLVLPRGVTERWSSHQYGPGGELCLEYGPDNWHPDLTGAEMVRSAHRLLVGERQPSEERSEVPSRHSNTLGQELRSAFSRMLVTRAFAAILPRIPEGESLHAELISLFSDSAHIHVPLSILFPDAEPWVDDLPRLKNYGYKRSAILTRWPPDEPLPLTDSLSTFRAVMAERGATLPDDGFVILVRGEDVACYRFFASDDYIYQAAILPQPPIAPRLDESHAALAERRVAIVGCGSLGSKLAVMLARSGVASFLLVDDDILLPDNLVRHDLDWRDVGTHKVDSLADKIQLANPNAVCAKRKHRLGGQEASGSIEGLIEKISGYHLLVDATADANVFNYLCAAAAISKISLLWTEVFAGGFGGLVARHRPLLDPDPAGMRRAIENWCADRGQPIERAVNRYEGGADLPHIADDADVTTIAGHAARMAIDLLIPRNPSVFPYSVYLIGLSKGWIFEQPFEVHPLDVGPPREVASEDRLDPAEHQAEVDRIVQLLTEHKNGAASNNAGDETTPA